ncbi:bifunctional aminoglycoside phosphotransferase/ATP-binding protein [Rhizobium rhizogenes]|uniref:bifunctional aminoglycoside phosphotransferase/ATP-binding protein n=1 Tax=Rhizobium rhizogenes TaxID=359 RepID=UPI0006460844|nr:bifunctional aminoglycoside phosphotransferase/ATP-binding protein [Rhizobium rhizogenes]
MIVEDQQAAVAFLSDPKSYGLASPVEMIETHISRIFLAGARAYKMKKAVSFPYVDFSTASLRLTACQKEMELNSRTAPGLYLGVKKLVRDINGAICFAESGECTDAVVEMVRFDQDLLFDRLAEADRLTDDLMTSTARMIVCFHQDAIAVSGVDGVSQMDAVLAVNEAGFATSTLFTDSEVAELSLLFRDRLKRHADRLRERGAAGKIKRCHGDLHLRNICLLDGQPRLFDCIEFNDAIATVDVLYDLAFLLMDLWHRGHLHHANLVANRYFDESENESGFALLPFFMAVRAAVRAHVTATQAETAVINRDKLRVDARCYFELAKELLQTKAPRLIAIGGLSGSGKTTVAEALAPKVGAPPGARIIESDRIRKYMHGVPAETHLPKAAYRPDVSRRVYAEMNLRTDIILADDGCVVADAVFNDLDHRNAIEMPARHRDIRFDGFWLETDPALLWRRVSGRQGGPSDANIEVLETQLARRLDKLAWRKIDASESVDVICGAILAGTEPDALKAESKSVPSVIMDPAI